MKTKINLYYRIGFIVLTVTLLLIAAFSIFRHTKSTTDENWFTNAVSLVSFNKDLPVLKKSREQFDKIKKGDLIFRINNLKRPASLKAVSDEIQSEKSDSLKLNIMRPEMNSYTDVVILKSSLPDSILTQLPNYVYVFSLAPGGASDRAGMKVGDLVTKIKGKSFSNAGEADTILRSNKAGETVAYEILRNNDPLTLYVKLSDFGIFFSNIFSILTGLFFIFTALLIVLKNTENLASRLLGASFIFIGFLLAISLMQREPGFDFFSTIRMNTVIMAATLGILFWFHSIFYFPKQLQILDKAKWLIKVFYIFAGLIFILLFAWNVTGFSINLINMLLAVFTVAVVGAVILISIILRKKYPKEIKVLTKPILYAGVATIIIQIILQLFLAQTIITQVSFGYVYVPFILIPFGYLYSIGRYKLLDIDIRLRRNIQYTLLSIGWHFFMIAVTVVLLFWLARANINSPNINISSSGIEILENLDPGRRLVADRIIFIVLTLVVVFLSWKITGFVQRKINFHFHQANFDYRQTISQLSELMYNNLNMNDLVDIVSQKLVHILRLKSIALAVLDQNNQPGWVKTQKTDLDKWQLFVNEENDYLLELSSGSNIFFTADKLNLKPADFFNNLGLYLFVPVKSSKSKTLGYLALGEKRSEAPFHHDDFEFLTAASRQVAIAFENSLLYTAVANQERLKLELEIARDIQMSSLPQDTPDIEGLDVAGISLPALEVGGDYFDYLNGKKDELTVVVGDVSGKGTSAALYMSKIQGILRSLHSFDLSPSDLFIRANQILKKDIKKQYFITAIAGSFNLSKNILFFARAGHLPLFYFDHSESAIQLLSPAGIGMGLSDQETFIENIKLMEQSFSSGDIFVFTTDGITEAFDLTGNEFGEDQVSNCLVNSAHLSAKEICQNLVSNVTTFSGSNSQHDDITVVVVKIC